MTSPRVCYFCNNEVDSEDESTWKQVKGWVGGPRKDSMRLRVDTGYYAHDRCVKKIAEGQSIDQPTIADTFEGSPEAAEAEAKRQKELKDLEDLLGDD